MSRTDTSRSEEPGPRVERVMTGLGVSPGLALGSAHVSDLAALSVPEYSIAADQVSGELDRFDAAVGLSRHQLLPDDFKKS